MYTDIIIGVLMATAIYFYVDVVISKSIDAVSGKKGGKKKTLEQQFREQVERERKDYHNRKLAADRKRSTK